MIRALTTAVPFSAEGEAAVKIAAQIEAYGLSQPFLRVYAGDGGSLLSVLDGAALLCPGEDAEEAELFLQMSPDVYSVRTDASTAERIAARRGVSAEIGVTMRYTGQPLRLENSVGEATPREAYPLLCEVFGEAMPPFDAWYADVSHRVRHGLCRLVGVREKGVLLSSAMTVAETPAVWWLGAVATKSEARGRGLASATVSRLTAMGQAAGRQVCISPKNEAAQRLYTRLGFEISGTWGNVSFG